MRHPFPKYDCPTTPRGILHLEPKPARERDLLHHETTNIADRLCDSSAVAVSQAARMETASSGHEEGGGWNKRDFK